MRYWLATHYPYESVAHPYNVYLKSEYARNIGAEISIDDHVAFSELKGSRRAGREAIVALASVSSAMESNPHQDDGPGWGNGRQPLIPGGMFSLSEHQYNEIETAFEASVPERWRSKR